MFLDLVLQNGIIYTMEEQMPTTAMVGVKGGRIASLDQKEIKPLITSKTEVVDLKGKVVLPGFIDAHCHILKHGLNLSNVDCSYPNIKSIEDIKDKIAERSKSLPKGKWIIGWGYDDSKLQEKRHPSRYDLDDAAGDHYVVIVRTCAHMMVANSKALKLSNIDRDTADPKGGKIDRDSSGEPTGLLRELAQDLVNKVIPPPSFSDLYQALTLASDEYVRHGITSIGEAGVGLTTGNLLEIEVFQAAWKQSNLLLRVYLMVMYDFLDELIKLGIQPGFGDEYLRISSIKMFLDGGFGGRTACLRRPYEGSQNDAGILYFEQEELDSKVLRAHAAGFQLAIHAIGDKAIENVLNSYEEALKIHPRIDHRHRIEHCGLCTPDLMERIKKLNIIPIPQAAVLYYLGDSFLANLGERVRWAYPLKSWIGRGLIPAGSSDSPVVPVMPMMGIYSAVNRQTISNAPIVPEESLTVREAIKMYTTYAAYASFEDTLKGTIKPGKYADFVVLEEDPFMVQPNYIKNISVAHTIINGKTVY